MGKVELHIEVDADLLAHAEEKGVELGSALEEGIRAALSRTEPSLPVGIVAAAEYQRRNADEAETAARRWAEENAEAIEAYARRVEERGVFGRDLRRW